MSKKLKKKAPELRFSEFKGDWESNYLDQIGEFKNGFNADKQAFGTGIEFINLMDIFGKSEIQKTHLGRVEIPEKQLEQYKIQKGDVLFVRSSVKREGVGQSCLINDDFKDTVYSGFIIRFREKCSILYHLYKKYCFAESSFRKEILSFATSSANTNINQDSLSQILLFYPSIAEQEKIASFLGAVDTRLNQLRRKRELLQTYKRGVMQKLFSQEIRFKGAIGSEFPDWEKKKLGEITSFSKGKGITKDDLVESGQLKCIRYAELYTLYGEVINYVISSTNLEPDSLVLSMKNDVIIPASGETAIDIAKAACVKMDGVALGGDVNILRTTVDGVFLAHYLNHYRKFEIASIAQGNTVAHLYASQLKNIPIEIPAEQEQEKIVNLLTAIDRKIEAISRQIDGCDRFKQGLLQKMFV